MFRFWILINLLVPFGLSALYNGNPSGTLLPLKNFFFPEFLPISLKAGFQYDDVFNRKLKGAKRFHIEDKLGVVAFDIIDRAEAYTALGVTKMHGTARATQGGDVAFATDEHFAWEVGGRVLFASWGRLDLGLDAAAFFVQPHIQRYIEKKVPFASSFLTQPAKALHYSEWQLGMGLSYRLPLIVPYLGIKYAKAHATIHSLVRMKSKKTPGMFLGIALAPPLSFDINVEARFFDETALTASAEIKF